MVAKTKPDGMTFVYGLHDPVTDRPRYLGKSDNPWRRYANHLCCKGNTHKCKWVGNLIRNGRVPRLVVYAQVREEACHEAERLLIEGFRQMGYPITNATDGGEGTPGHKQSDTTKCRIGDANRGRKYGPPPEDRRQKNSEWHKGKLKSAETRQRMSEAQRGRAVTEEAKHRQSESRKGIQFSAEHRRKLSERATAQWAQWRTAHGK